MPTKYALLQTVIKKSFYICSTNLQSRRYAQSKFSSPTETYPAFIPNKWVHLSKASKLMARLFGPNNFFQGLRYKNTLEVPIFP